MKKFLKISGIIIGLLIVILLLTPFLFKGTIEDLIKKNLNDNLNAKVEWASLDISLFRSFPSAQVRLEEFSVVNFEPFEGDTLASGKSLAIDMGISQLFSTADEPVAVNALHLSEAFINLKIDSLGRENFNIAKETETAVNDTVDTEGGFSFDLKQYDIEKSRVIYSDDKSKTYFEVNSLNHQGTGDFSLSQSELDTETSAVATLSIEDVKYLNETELKLDALFQMDLENQRFTFRENEALINQLPLTFDGYIQLNEDNTELDLKFNTPSSDFRNFLAVIPKKYVKNLDGVTTTGDFTVDAELNGMIDEETIPKMDIKVSSNNASFKYPDLPKSVQNITIDARLKNDTGLAKDTYLNIGNLTFRIDDEPFNLKGSILNLATNALIDMELKGTLDLANIERVLPLELEQDLSGVFNADVRTKFDQRSIETEQYDKIRTTGNASLNGFTYKDPDFKNPVEISTADMSFSPGNIRLEKLEGKTGSTDISASGTVQNLIPWIMSKQDLRGVFTATSNTFDLNDFKEPEAGLSEASPGGQLAAEEGIKIPDFLDATINFRANKVIYDDIIMENAKGSVGIQNETARLSNVTSSVFGGNVAFSGDVSTLKKTPTFNMDLDLNQVRIADSFKQLDLLQYLAPVANALEGNLNTKLKLSGNLSKDLTPDLKTLAGNAAAQILTAEVRPQNAPVLSKLGEQVPFLNLNKLSLKDLSTAFTFNNGKIEVKPFNIQVEDINIMASGSHGLDKSMQYRLVMDVPAKYMGGEVNKLLSQLDPKEASEMKVSVPVNVSGNALNPQVKVDMKSAATALTNQLLEKQKQELTNKGTDILKGILGGKDDKKDPKDPKKGDKPKGNQTEEVVKDIIGNIFGGNKKKKDSVN